MNRKAPTPGAAATSTPFADLPPILCCPHCADILQPAGRSLTCPSGHNYDLAREGYAHLSRSKQTGDSKAMLGARHRFLEAGYYQPLSDLVNRLVGEHRTDSPGVILDVGCGEGYYLGRLTANPAVVRARPPATAPPSSEPRNLTPSASESTAPLLVRTYHAIGLDAAKDAARMAAARYRDTAFLVADLKDHLPIAAGEIDILLNIFAPRNAGEFFRVLRPGGLLLSVIPEPDHLHELRGLLPLLGIEERKEEQVRATLEAGFVPVGAARLSYIMNLSAQAMSDLVDMTPSARHLDGPIRERLGESATAVYSVTASFLVLSFHRRYTLVDSPAS